MSGVSFRRLCAACVVVAAVLAAGSAFGAGLERTAEAGGVSAAVVPVNGLDENAPTLDFTVTMDTHAGSLPLDMAKVATAQGPAGAAIPALSWKGGKGGHHLSGTLSFPSGTLRMATPLKVTLKGEGGTNLVFTWQAALLGPRQGTRVSVEGGTYLSISPATLGSLLERKDFFLVNVHVPYEGEIASTDAFIPYDQTVARLALYPADKAAQIVLYCRSGRMSDLAARKLVRRGYVNVSSLDGGMTAWEKAGLPLKGTQGRG
jgi:rhodanese-related sulfurtransferase